MSTLEQVREFHNIFGHPAPNSLAIPELDTIKLRFKLILEEYIEFIEANSNDTSQMGIILGCLIEADSHIDDIIDEDIDVDFTEVADALGDIKYVVDGAALVYGIPLDDVSTEIHASNMSKLDPDTGKPLLREDGKILKGSAYFKPDIKKAISYGRS